MRPELETEVRKPWKGHSPGGVRTKGRRRERVHCIGPEERSSCGGWAGSQEGHLKEQKVVGRVTGSKGTELQGGVKAAGWSGQVVA